MRTGAVPAKARVKKAPRSTRKVEGLTEGGKRIPVEVAPAKRRKLERPLTAAVKVVSNSDLAYTRSAGVVEFVRRVAAATPMEMVSVERGGVNTAFLKDLSKYMQVPAVRIFDIVGVPKATAEKKAAAQAPIAGAGGQAALGLARLLAMANSIVDNSTSQEAQGFDAGKWLGQWIERPQPALGGQKPADLIGTPTGLAMVARLLGAIESGAYI